LIIQRQRLQETHLSTHHDAEYWRRRANEVRATAEQMSRPEHKRDLLDIAAGYEQLAKLAEDKKVRGGVSAQAANQTKSLQPIGD
jgi:hypothetical protein